jgi:hypothetical protein
VSGEAKPVARILDSAHDATGIPLRAMPYVFEPRPKDLTRVLVAAEFDASLLGVSRGRAGRLELSMLATHRDTDRELRFEVFGAARGDGGTPPRVSAGLVLSQQDGRTVVEAAPSPIAADPDGRVVRLVGLPLDGLETGAYELRLEVRDQVSGARIERREPFTLAREARSQ